jgi:hypothetical protein
MYICLWLPKVTQTGHKILLMMTAKLVAIKQQTKVRFSLFLTVTEEKSNILLQTAKGLMTT